MATETDPYRVLGLARGASLDEVKRAYRRLAKANHPDAAGETALPRFLAIQAAYDQIVGPGASGGGAPGAGRRTAGPYRPWEADPSRADATRRAYGGRGRRERARSRPSEAGAGGTSGAGGTGRTGPPPRDDDARPRPPKKATLGSTSYDDADTGPFEPDWRGASWYGTTSGTYWTLNPKEYADPRKHGPEYQARARRAAAAAATDEEPEVATAAASTAAAGAPTGTTEAPEVEPTPPPTHTTTSWWQATAADPATAADDGPVVEPTAAPGGPAPADDTGDAPSPWDATTWLEPGTGGLPARVGRAVIGWAPIALGIGWLAGEITGCSRFAAGCDSSAAPIAWFAQLLALAVLLLIPRIAGAATIAAIATLVAAIPGAVLLSAAGGVDEAGMARIMLGGLLVIGWVVGLAIGIDREVRRLRPVS